MPTMAFSHHLKLRVLALRPRRLMIKLLCHFSPIALLRPSQYFQFHGSLVGYTRRYRNLIDSTA